MTFVDTSVWIDWLRGASTPHTDALAQLMRSRRVLVGDLVLVELLQGIAHQGQLERTRAELLQLSIVEVAGLRIALQAVHNYRRLRALGCTIRGTIDTLIATRCIAEGWSLLASDRDFLPFAEHLGLDLISI